ncbi:MAG: discoidin domain-containing protein [Polyangiaceae bacterium]|nr:discoidin domain-containing protein [Polyangiaceae bacterium]
MVDSEREREANGTVGDPAPEKASTGSAAGSGAVSSDAAPSPAVSAPEGTAPEPVAPAPEASPPTGEGTAGDADARVAASAVEPAPAASTEEGTAPAAAGEGAPAAAPAANPVAAGPSFWTVVRRFFWMDEKLAAARRVGFAPGSSGYVEFELGREGLIAAQRLSELADGKLGALLLGREVAQLLVAAHVARSGIEADPEPAARWAALSAHSTGEAVLTGVEAADRELLDRFLAADGTYFVAGLPKDRRNVLATVATRVTERLAERLESEMQRVASVLYQRWLRIIAAVMLVFALLGGFFALVRSTQPLENIARDKNVRLSSNSKKYGCPPRQVVDGNRNELGFHTNNDNQPWVEIDLDGEKTVHRVVVYNRASHPERAVPLALELATEPGKFEEVARRNEVFDVWTAEVPARKAKLVRLKLLKKGFFHLAEIEVY